MPPQVRKQHANSFLFLYNLEEVTDVQFQIGSGIDIGEYLATNNIDIEIWQGSENCVVENLVRQKTTFGTGENHPFGQAELKNCYKFAIFKNPNKGNLKFKISVRGTPESWVLAYVRIILGNGKKKYICGNHGRGSMKLRAYKAGDKTDTRHWSSSMFVDCIEEAQAEALISRGK